MKKLFLFAIAMMAALAASAAETKVIPLAVAKDNTTQKYRPRMPAKYPTPACFYNEGVLTVYFPTCEGNADVTISSADGIEQHTVSTDTYAVFTVDLAIGDTVEITTEAGNSYIAIYEE